MKTFDIARALYSRLEQPLGGRVALGVVNVTPEQVAEPLTVIHVQQHTPGADQRQVIRRDSVIILLTTMLDAAGGEIYSRLEPHLNALRSTLFADNSLGGEAGIILVTEIKTHHQFNRDELVYLVDLEVDVSFRRKSVES